MFRLAPINMSLLRSEFEIEIGFQLGYTAARYA